MIWWLRFCLAVLAPSTAFAQAPAVAMAERATPTERFVIRDSRGYGFMDRQGKVVIAPQFKAATGFEEGLARVEVEPGAVVAGQKALAPFHDPASDRWGLLDLQGRVAVEPRFDHVWGLRHGLAAVNLQGKWGYIDRSGALVLPAQWDGAEGFSDGMARVKVGETYGYIDAKGKLAIAPQHDSPMHYMEWFHSGLALVARRDAKGRLLWAWIDRKGKVVWAEK